MVLKANDCEGSSVKEKETDNNIFKKIDEMKAYARIVAQIKDLIEDGSLVHGSRLPSETELARSFGVSRNTVREALLVLEYMGFVKISKGKSTEVMLPSTESVLNKLSCLSVGENSFISDLNETRILLEPQIASLAAQRATDEEIFEMQQCIAEHEKHLMSFLDIVDNSAKIHELILVSCHNKTLEAIMRPINNYVVSFSRFVLGFKEQPERILADHQAIVREIASRNGPRAAAAMLKHLDSIKEFYSVL